MEDLRASTHGAPNVEDDLAFGDRVRFHGLGAAAKWNGHLGEVVEYHGEMQRYEVRTEGEERTKAVKRENLTLRTPSCVKSGKPKDERGCPDCVRERSTPETTRSGERAEDGIWSLCR